MEPLPNVADGIRKMTETFAEALSTVTRSLESLPKQSTETQRLLAEQWLRLARMSKDGVVTALNQGFDLWERECRRALGVAGVAPSGNPMEAWAENWKRVMDAFTAACGVGDVWSEEARKQAQLLQQNFQEAMRAWQRLWQTWERKP